MKDKVGDNGSIHLPGEIFRYIAKFMSSLLKNISPLSKIFRYIVKYFEM